MTNFICLDIETTGLDKTQDSIIEVAAVLFNETEILSEYQTFIHYGEPIPEIVEHLTGIKQDMLIEAPSLEQVKQDIFNFCGDLPIMGHNINFDLDFLDLNGIVLPGTRIDTLPLSQILIKNSQSYSLETLCRNLNKKFKPSHRALDDCLANIELFQLFIQEIKSLNPNQSWLWNRILSKSADPLASYLIDWLPSEKTKPEFTSLEATHHKPTIKNETETEIIKKSAFDPQDCKGLFVTDQNNFDTFKNQFTELPRLNSLISTDLFMNLIEEDLHNRDLTNLLLKIATLITDNYPLYKSDIQIFGDEYQYIQGIIHKEYLLPKTDKPYITDHLTFFRLTEKKILPEASEIHFQNAHFLEETYVKSKEKQISLNLAENGNPTDEMLVVFGQIGIFINKIVPATHSDYDPVIFDPIASQSKEFRDYLNEIYELTDNEDLKIDIQELKNNTAYYLIWSYIQEGRAPTIFFIEKELAYDLNEILQKTNIEKAFVYPTDHDSKPFTILTNENYPTPKEENHHQTLIDQIWKQFSTTTREGLIISTSNAQMSDIHKSLATKFDELGISLLTQNISGSKGKIMDNIENREGPLILLCTQHFYLRFKPKFSNLESAMLTKLPMSLPSHTYYQYISNQIQNSFSELTIPHTAQLIYQICQQLSQEPGDLSSMTLMDNRIITTSWGQEIKSKLPENIIIQT